MFISRASSRPPCWHQTFPDHAMNIYWSRFLEKLFDKKFVVNIDEAGFTKSVKTNYSWLPIDSDAPIINQLFKGRSNLVLAVSQYGDWLGIIKRGTVWAIDYALFITVLIKVISWWGFDVKNDVVFLQDDCFDPPWKKIIKRLAIEEDLKMLFLPAYCPELALIETLFSLIKAKVRRNVDE